MPAVQLSTADSVPSCPCTLHFSPRAAVDARIRCGQHRTRTQPAAGSRGGARNKCMGVLKYNARLRPLAKLRAVPLLSLSLPLFDTEAYTRRTLASEWVTTTAHSRGSYGTAVGGAPPCEDRARRADDASPDRSSLRPVAEARDWIWRTVESSLRLQLSACSTGS